MSHPPNADNADGYYQLARTACRQGRLADGIALAHKALAVDPRHARAHRLLGMALGGLSRHEEALTSLDRAVAIDPGLAAAHGARADTLIALGRVAESIVAYDRALALAPDSVDDWCNRGAALYDIGRYDEALASYDRVIALKPEFAQAHYNRGNALVRLDRTAEAVESYDQALALEPDLVDAHSSRGHALNLLDRHDEALASLHRALALAPGHVDALNNLGTVLAALNRHGDAIVHYERALAFAPANDDVRANLALARLSIGDFQEGWRDYERRWNAKAFPHTPRAFSQPLWLGGTAIAGKTILLHAEQGSGDTIQFARYAPLLAERGARVIVECQRELVTLLQGLDGIAVVVAQGAPLPSFDLHCPFMSLPLAFGTCVETIPADIPYLRAGAERTRVWRERLGTLPRPRVGLVWSGTRAHKNDRARSIALARLAPLLALPGVQFISVQRDVRAEDRPFLAANPSIVHIGDDLRDFADTAGLLTQLDVLISVDTAPAHLAGAMGMPVYLLLPYSADFRWLTGRHDSPWYPSARLFRQPALGDWDSVIARLREAVATHLKSLPQPAN